MIENEFDVVGKLEHTRRFRRVSIDMLKMKRTKHQVEPAISLQFMGDFNGLLDLMEVPRALHVVCCKVNGLRCSDDFMGDKYEIIIMS